jgi:signal transduction histidine kinase
VVSLAAVTFVAGAAFVLTIYHRTLVADQERTVAATARAVAANMGRGPLPRPIPMPVGGDVTRVQAIDAAGRVVTGDPVSFYAPPMLTLPTGEATRAVTVQHPSFLSAHRAAVVGVRASGASSTVVAALSLDPADDKAAQAERLAAIALGVSLVAVAAAAWVTTGRALRSVERLRSDVALITTHGALTQRVPVGPDEIGRLAGTLNQMLASLERSTDRQRRFVADAAHELRTPLVGVTAALEVAAPAPTPASPPKSGADTIK